MISAPEDYGLSLSETLAHQCATPTPPDFGSFWSDFREAVRVLPPRPLDGRLSKDSSQLTIRSLRDVRIIGRYTPPVEPPRGAVVTTHGYSIDGPLPVGDEPWTESGLATLRLRVRAFPPSTLDVRDLSSDWILHHIDRPDSWILRGAVADLVQGYRLLRQHFGPAFPIALHGESFGGGLAAIAAAQLTAMSDPPHRLVLALPSFGDWRWRYGRFCNGAGGTVNMYLDALRGDDHDRLRAALDLFDAAIHARTVTSPTLARLATRDDVVPAPSAAAIFNAIGHAEGWRFVTRFGHYEGGLADLRRIVQWERLHPAFLDPARPPADIIDNFPQPLELPINTAARPHSRD